MNSDRRLPIDWRVAAVFLAVGAIWGSAWIPQEALTRSLPGLAAGAMRFGLAAVVLGILAIFIRPRTSGESKHPIAGLLLPAAVLGMTMLALPYALTVWAASRVSPGLVALCFGLMPLGVLLFGNEGGAEVTAPLTAVVLGIGGVAMVVAPGLSFGLQQAAPAMGLLAAAGLGGFSLVYARRLVTRNRVRPADIPGFAAIQLGVASVILTVLLVSEGQRPALQMGAAAALPLTLLAIVVSGGTLPLLYWLLGRITAAQAGMLQWVATLVAVAEAAAFIGAKPAAEAWIGAALIPCCILWAFLASRTYSTQNVTLEITNSTFQARKASEFRGEPE